MQNEILELSKEEIENLKKSFQSVSDEGSEYVTVVDWLDDSVQTVKVR